jgi:hypothetical protein
VAVRGAKRGTIWRKAGKAQMNFKSQISNLCVFAALRENRIE